MLTVIQTLCDPNKSVMSLHGPALGLQESITSTRPRHASGPEAGDEPSRSFTVPGEGPYTKAFSLLTAPISALRHYALC